MKRLLVAMTIFIAIAIAAFFPLSNRSKLVRASKRLHRRTHYRTIRQLGTIALAVAESLTGANLISIPTVPNRTGCGWRDRALSASSRHKTMDRGFTCWPRRSIPPSPAWRLWPIMPRFSSEAATAIRLRAIARCSGAATRSEESMPRVEAGCRNRTRWTRCSKPASSRTCHRLTRGDWHTIRSGLFGVRIWTVCCATRTRMRQRKNTSKRCRPSNFSGVLSQFLLPHWPVRR